MIHDGLIYTFDRKVDSEESWRFRNNKCLGILTFDDDEVKWSERT